MHLVRAAEKGRQVFGVETDGGATGICTSYARIQLDDGHPIRINGKHTCAGLKGIMDKL